MKKTLVIAAISILLPISAFAGICEEWLDMDEHSAAVTWLNSPGNPYRDQVYLGNIGMAWTNYGFCKAGEAFGFDR